LFEFKIKLVMMKKHILLAAFASIAIVFNACKNDPEDTVGIDKEMHDLSKTTTGFTWYKFSSAFLDKSAGTGHSEALVRTRYNATAAAMLDSVGKVRSGITFPEGSLVVKELHESASKFNRYAIMLKRSAAEEADETNWVWGYINADGSVAEPAKNKGKSCRGCHSQEGHIDLTLMNKSFE
jgi:hypothetical protein